MATIEMRLLKDRIYVRSKKRLSKKVLGELSLLEEHSENIISCSFTPYNSFVWNNLIKEIPDAVDCDFQIQLERKANTVPRPVVFMAKPGWALLEFPLIKTYIEFLDLVGAKQQRMALYSVPFSRLYELLRMIRVWQHPFLPQPFIDDTLKEYISNFKSKTISSLFKIPLEDLVSIKHGYRINSKGFEKLNMLSAADILLHRPRKYDDRSELSSLKHPNYSKNSFYKVTVIAVSKMADNKRLLVEFEQNDIQGKAYIYGVYLTNILYTGAEVILDGIPSSNNIFYNARILKVWEVKALPIAPVYPQSPTNGLKSNVLINCVQELLERCSLEEMSPYFLDEKNIGNNKLEHDFFEIINNLHFPMSREIYLETISELAFIELVYMQIIFASSIEDEGFKKGYTKKKTLDEIPKKAIESLPFKLTQAQQSAINELLELFGDEEASKSIISGDVGSGKTIVAQIVALQTVNSGQQVAIVGPTEVLAQQLYNTTIDLVNNINAKLEKPITVAFLSGSVNSSDSRFIKEETQKGRIDILIGTHSLFNLEYNKLGLVIIDEQHKFGANQRQSLITPDKNGRIPDLISQTATPIPRSTALAFYRDTTLIQIKGKPVGRLPVKTKWVKEDPLKFIKTNKLTDEDNWDLITEELNKNNQVFVVCSAVVEDDNKKQVSVEEATKILTKRFKGNKNINIGIIHGQMSKDDQNKAIETFRNKETNILIASSIVEVGVDIPDATVMIVLDAHRFGAAQLHQIRGRVGRNSMQSYCYLIAPDSETSKDRLESLVNSNDGFEIALVDLKTRSQGDIFGERQSGESNLRFVDIIDHSNMVEDAKEAAEKLFESPVKEQVIADAKAFLRIEK